MVGTVSARVSAAEARIVEVWRLLAAGKTEEREELVS